MSERELTYAEAETVLAKMHSVHDAEVQRGAFRGRLKHLRKLGVPLGSNPGRGKKTTYGLEHLFQWSFCLELSEFGIDPSVIAEITKSKWDMEISPYYFNSLSAKWSTFCLLTVRFMASTWSGQPGVADMMFPIGEKELQKQISLNFGSRRCCVFDIGSAAAFLRESFVNLQGGNQ